MADINAVAEALWTARETRSPVSASTEAFLELTLDDARAVSRRLYARILADGDQCIGWKMGATDPEARHRLGDAAPLSAPLFRSHCVESGSEIRLSDLLAPRIEAEIGLCGPHDHRKYCPLLEIADTRLLDWPSDAVLTTADFCLQSHIILGRPVAVESTAPLSTLRLSYDNNLVDAVQQVAPPDIALAMLLRPSEAAGVQEPVIATGAQTQARLMGPGLWVADFAGLGAVSVRVAP
jgi:2-keto-4-pentenoate hydratase